MTFEIQCVIKGKCHLSIVTLDDIFPTCVSETLVCSYKCLRRGSYQFVGIVYAIFRHGPSLQSYQLQISSLAFDRDCDVISMAEFRDFLPSLDF